MTTAINAQVVPIAQLAAMLAQNQAFIQAFTPALLANPTFLALLNNATVSSLAAAVGRPGVSPALAGDAVVFPQPGP